MTLVLFYANVNVNVGWARLAPRGGRESECTEILIHDVQYGVPVVGGKLYQHDCTVFAQTCFFFLWSFIVERNANQANKVRDGTLTHH